jgi:hypothetical protein
VTRGRGEVLAGHPIVNRRGAFHNGLRRRLPDGQTRLGGQKISEKSTSKLLTMTTQDVYDFFG